MKFSNQSRLRRVTAITLVAMGLALASPALAKKKPEPPVDYGPTPTWERFKELAERAVRARLVDPGSANFDWIWGFRQGFYKPMLGRRIHGYYSCGLVNARNRMGGYTGRTYFIVVIDNDAVRYVDIARNTYSSLGDSCSKAELPPVSTMQMAKSPGPGYGITFFPDPDGFLVVNIMPGLPAERAGIRPGMVIALINGIPLKGLSQQTAQQMLSNLSGTARVELVDGTVFTLRRL